MTSVMNWNDPSRDALTAVDRAQNIVGLGGQYLLGTGDFAPRSLSSGMIIDQPWTDHGDGQWGSDCAGFICWAWKLKRHRPGFNKGPWSTVEDDINCNSLLEDSVHLNQLCTRVLPGETILPGDCLAWPTFTVQAAAPPHSPLTFIGHIGLILSVPCDFPWSVTDIPHWSRLTIAQCHGPNGFKPGVVRTDGMIWQQHDLNWGKEEHKTHVVRIKPLGTS